MKTRTLFWVVLCALLLVACNKPNNDAPTPIIEEENHVIGPRSAKFSVKFQFDGDLNSIMLYYGEKEDLSDERHQRAIIIDNTIFTVTAKDLKANTKYYYAYEFKTEKQSQQTPVNSFKTKDTSKPIVETGQVTDLGLSTAKLGGTVVDDGGDNLSARGVCWSKSEHPTLSNNYTSEYTSEGAGNGNFTCTLTDLEECTTYYACAYATNEKGTSYGEQVHFTTLATPTVITADISNIGAFTATCGGNVGSDGGATVTARGVCWSTSQNPTVSGSHTTDGTGTGSFTSSMTGLTAGTTYYVRAYATNGAGTAYGEQKEFTTVALSLPSVTTSQVTEINRNSAVCGGEVTETGNLDVTARGVCWSTSQNPTVSGSHTSNGTGTGSFTSSMTGLTAGTTYYVRAYATNGAGTAYGEQKTFTTESASLPTVTTNAVTDVAATIAICGGNVTSDGGSSVTARGICWSTSQNPTISNAHTSEGSGLGTFDSKMTGLTPGTTYYVRAYATNSKGTAYGSQKTFKTINTPNVQTKPATNITQSSATAGGNVISDNGLEVIRRGVKWGTSESDLNLTAYTGTGGTGLFTVSLTGLTAGATYYYKAFATNAGGTSYGDVVSFTTRASNFTVNGVTFEMVAVQGGTFTMGATSEQGSDYYDDEKPTHSVTLSDYMIGKYEVTQELWQAVMGSNPSYFSGSNLPVERVSWNDCQEFIRKLNQLTGQSFRLPTEAEWEYAARGGRSEGYKYSGSNNIGNVAWYQGNSSSKTHPVGTKSPNELGIYDMSGNVFEWCEDWYGSYSSGSQTNPQGPSSGSSRVLRGGSWNSRARHCRVSYRGNSSPSNSSCDLGFRLALQ